MIKLVLEVYFEKNNKKEFKVICNYPTEENMDKFQDIMCEAMAKAIIASKPPEYVEAFKKALVKRISED